MNIPDKAVEAAARAEYLSPTPGLEFAVEPDWDSLAEHEKQHWRDDIRASLEAAAPFIAAQALRDYAAEMYKWCGEGEVITTGDVIADLVKTAERLEAGK